MIEWDKIRREFEQEDITLKALAEKYNLSPSTVRSRKNREDWQRNENRNVATRRNATDKPGGQRENKNATGNSGGSPPKGNQNAFKHGLFSKYMPEESLRIAEELSDSDPSDIIWNNIMIQYTAIIRAQKIMFVESQDDLSKETSGWSSGAKGGSESYAIQYAWDKQANFMNAQARAMKALSDLIKQFVLISDEQDERRQKLTLMKAQITKAQAEAKIAQHEADKLTNSNAGNDLLKALLDVKSGGDGSGSGEV